MKTVFLRALEAEDKSEALLTAIRASAAAPSKQRFDVDPTSFASIQRSPFAYWAGQSMLAAFTNHELLQTDTRRACAGAVTNDNTRFLRLWWEILSQSTWHPFAKGGAFSPYYSDITLLLAWANDGEELKDYIGTFRADHGWSPHWAAELHNAQYYFRPGLTWPLRTNGLSLRAMPSGCIFGHKGPAIIVTNDDSRTLLALAAVTNSRAFGLLVSLQLARTELAQSYEVGLIQRTPVPTLTAADSLFLAKLSRRGWSVRRSRDTRNETSHAFILPALLQAKRTSLVERSAAWVKLVNISNADSASIQAEIDIRCFELYGIDDTDLHGIAASSSGALGQSDSDAAEPDATSEAESDPDEAENSDADSIETLTAELLSWAVGVAFGRFDVRLATGARALPPEPEPFDALPVCSPGMLTGDDGLPLSAPPAGYPLKFTENGILVDDPGHPLDLTAAVRAVFDVVFGADAHARWNEAAAILDPKEQNLRNWLSRGFFEQHLKRHSKSRRKAPIVWQLATASSSYAVWLYAHRINKDTFFQVQNDLVAKKLFHEEGVQTKLEKEAATSPSPSQRKELAAQASLLEELRTLLDEVKRIAALWQPNLDDGVVLTMAPLFRLVPQHKAWQKELKAGWDGLAAGKFDWAHLAMHLWPERVVPKCATDRSLAIAHGLEDVFWVEATEGKWKARPAPTWSVDELVRDRTSSAVKASLKSLGEAPIVGAGAGGAKRGGARGPRGKAS